MNWINRAGSWVDIARSDMKARASATAAMYRTRPGMAAMDLGQCVIRYRVTGSGSTTVALAADPPIVIEHYDELIAELERDVRVVVFEVPGFGFSHLRKGASFAFADSNDLVATFLAQLGFGPYVLAFPCVTAYGAIDIAGRFPELVRSVVNIQAPSWSEEIKWKHGRDPKGILSRPLFGQVALQVLKRSRAPQWLDAAVGDRTLLPHIAAVTDQAFAQGACFCLASAFQEYLTDAPPQLLPVKQPSLVIWGDADRSHRRTQKASSAELCPNAPTLHFAEAGHFPELERPLEFARELRAWLRGQQSE